MFHFWNISGHLSKGVVYSTSVANRRTRARADGASLRGVTTRAALIFLVLTALLSLSVAAPTTSEARKKRVKGIFTCVNHATGAIRVLVKTSKARCNPVQEFRLSRRKKRPKQRARMVVSQRITTNQWLDLVRQAVISSLGDGASGDAGTVRGEPPEPRPTSWAGQTTGRPVSAAG